jgi:Ni,Fe-hydrogenase III small subunit/ferredoxin
MFRTLYTLLTTGFQTQRDLFPDLPEDAVGLPAPVQGSCDGTACGRCAAACPLGAIAVEDDAGAGVVTLDRGKCLGCQRCVAACPRGLFVADRSTRLAVRSRGELILSNRPHPAPAPTLPPSSSMFRHSLHVREVSTGCSASDLEVLASTNAVFDLARFGIHIVASPRFADALLVTGPVGRAMQEPLRRCYAAMAEPRLTIAAGVSAISGGVHAGGYAAADGVDAILPVDVYIPGDPPHPWSLIHGMVLAMGKPASCQVR